ncbi:TadE family type IV pilus minor pilin [Streptomyces sp. S063]|uniref:TadE family type IV pilus minor pilin n=1 Tax=Streptomyces sp. S063 TaxID=2005885 RepID=UPI001F164393|nr:TadE family type IV pilus minor pilin [Streptomyces sp. S063]
MTAEAAVVIPVLVAFVLALLWALLAAADQIRCVDAARAGARAAARSEPETAVLGAARDAAPQGARVEMGRAGDMWRVRVEAPTRGPRVLALTLSAEAAALAEDTVGVPDHEGEESWRPGTGAGQTSPVGRAPGAELGCGPGVECRWPGPGPGLGPGKRPGPGHV